MRREVGGRPNVSVVAGVLASAWAVGCVGRHPDDGPEAYLGPAVVASSNGQTEVFALDGDQVGDRLFRVQHPEEDRPMSDVQFLERARDELGRPLLAVLVNTLTEPSDLDGWDQASFIVVKDVDGGPWYRVALPFVPHHTFAQLPEELAFVQSDGARSVLDFLVIAWGPDGEDGITDDFYFVHVFADGSSASRLAWRSTDLPAWPPVVSQTVGQHMHSNGLDCGDPHGWGAGPVCAVSALVPSVVYLMRLDPAGPATLVWDTSSVDWTRYGLSLAGVHSPDLTADGVLWFFHNAVGDDAGSQVIAVDTVTNEVIAVVHTDSQKARGAVTVLDAEHVLITHSADGAFCVEDVPSDPGGLFAMGSATRSTCGSVAQAEDGVLRAYFRPDLYWVAP